MRIQTITIRLFGIQMRNGHTRLNARMDQSGHKSRVVTPSKASLYSLPPRLRAWAKLPDEDQHVQPGQNCQSRTPRKRSRSSMRRNAASQCHMQTETVNGQWSSQTGSHATQAIKWRQ